MKSLFVGTPIIDPIGLIHYVNKINNRLSDDITAFTFRGNTNTTYVYYKETNEFYDDFFSLGRRHPTQLKFFELQIDTEYLDTNGHVVKIVRIISDNQCYSEDGELYNIQGFKIINGSIKYDESLIGINNKYVLHKFETDKFKDSSLVDMNIYELNPIPSGSNPYLYDTERSGLGLVHGWEAMFSSSTGPLKELILINKTSGQRFKLELNKRPTNI